VDLGPGAGVHGGHLVAQGTPRDIAANPASITGQYLAGKRRIEVPGLRIRPDPARQIRIVGARGNNLAQVTTQIPLGLLPASGVRLGQVDAHRRHAVRPHAAR